MKKSLAFILAILFTLPLLLSACTQETKTPLTTETTQTTQTTQTESKTPHPTEATQTKPFEPGQIGLTIHSYSSENKFNPVLDVRYNRLSLDTAFYTNDPERKIFEVEITISLQGCPESDLKNPFPESFFHKVSLVLDSESETKTINGTATDIDSSVLEKLPEDTVKGRYSFDLSDISDKGDYSLEIVLSPKSRSSEKNTIHTLKNAVTIGEKIEFACETAVNLADQKLESKAKTGDYQYYSPNILRYDYEDDYYHTWFYMYLGKYRTNAAYGAYIDMNEKKVTKYEFKDSDGFHYFFNKVTKEDISEVENALLKKVNDYLIKDGRETYTLENAPFWLISDGEGSLTLQTELILDVKEGEFAPCGDHKHVIFEEDLYPR